jgi:hypothetical protein
VAAGARWREGSVCFMLVGAGSFFARHQFVAAVCDSIIEED